MIFVARKRLLGTGNSGFNWVMHFLEGHFLDKRILKLAWIGAIHCIWKERNSVLHAGPFSKLIEKHSSFNESSNSCYHSTPEEA